MKHATTPAFDMLHSLDFFTDLRTALAGVGLAGEKEIRRGGLLRCGLAILSESAQALRPGANGGRRELRRAARGEAAETRKFRRTPIRLDRGLAWFHERSPRIRSFISPMGTALGAKKTPHDSKSHRTKSAASCR